MNKLKIGVIYGGMSTENEVSIMSAKSVIEIMAQQKFNNKLKAKLVNYNRKTTLGDYFSDISEYGAKSNLKLTDFMPLSMILSKRPLYLWE